MVVRSTFETIGYVENNVASVMLREFIEKKQIEAKEITHTMRFNEDGSVKGIATVTYAIDED